MFWNMFWNMFWKRKRLYAVVAAATFVGGSTVVSYSVPATSETDAIAQAKKLCEIPCAPEAIQYLAIPINPHKRDKVFSINTYI